MFGRWSTRVATVWLVATLSILAACGGEPATLVPTATAISPSATPSPSLNIESTTAATPKRATPVPISTTRPPLLSPTLSATPVPAIGLQSADLTLQVTSPEGDRVVTSPLITVAGLTSPDATVSVNGILALPDAEGRFSVDLLITQDENPLSIEVIATSLSGEQESVIRTVIFLP